MVEYRGPICRMSIFFGGGRGGGYVKGKENAEQMYAYRVVDSRPK